MIAERNDLGQPAPVVYVSGEEVSVCETSYWLVALMKAENFILSIHFWSCFGFLILGRHIIFLVR